MRVLFGSYKMRAYLLVMLAYTICFQTKISTSFSGMKTTRNREIAFNRELQKRVRNRAPGSVIRAEKFLLDTLFEFEENREYFKNNSISADGFYYVRPNHYSFGIVIDGYAKSRDPMRAENLLVLMETLHLQGRDFLRPDAVKYTSCINAWTRSNRRGSAHKAERLLRKMEQSYYLKGERRLKPTLVTYAAVIDSWGKNKERNPQVSAPRRAEDILKRMEFRFENGEKDIEPDTVVYNCVLNAWANSSHKEHNVPVHVENILRRMIIRYRKGISSTLPDVNTYNIIMKSWANSRNKVAPYRCEEILSVMESHISIANDSYNDPLKVVPNTVTYNTVLSAWLKSDLTESLERSRKIIEKMEHLMSLIGNDVRPDHTTNIIMNEILRKYSGQ